MKLSMHSVLAIAIIGCCTQLSGMDPSRMSDQKLKTTLKTLKEQKKNLEQRIAVSDTAYTDFRRKFPTRSLSDFLATIGMTQEQYVSGIQKAKTELQSITAQIQQLKAIRHQRASRPEPIE